MGLLHYHIGHLPGFTRFLSSLLVTSGDRQKGLQELELAAKKGYLLKDLAKAELGKALDVEGGEGAAQVAAKQYLKTPYSPANRR
jgi:hypothetical protein